MSSTTPPGSESMVMQPDVVADRILRRAELGKMARRLQNRLALAQFKTQHGWEDLTLDMIEPKVEDEIRRKRISDGDMLSDSSSSSSDLPYPLSRGGLMSSPLKAPMFSDAIGSSNGSTGHRKRSYIASFDDLNSNPLHSRHASFMMSSPSKRYRSSPPLDSRHASGSMPSGAGAAAYYPSHPSFTGHAAWKDHHQLSHSSPIKPRRQQHFTTAAGPDVSLFSGTRRIAEALSITNYNAAQSSDDDDLLPTHSFQASSMSLGPSGSGLTSTAGNRMRAGSPPSTPPMQSRGLPNGNGRRKKRAGGNGNEGREPGSGLGINNGADNENGGPGGKSVEGADLLLYLAASPSPANPTGKTRMEPPSTPPSKFSNLALPSSMMTTPGGGSMFPNTPGQTFDFADYVNITPSPAQKPWKTPNLGLGSKTPLSVARRRLTFDDPL